MNKILYITHFALAAIFLYSCSDEVIDIQKSKQIVMTADNFEYINSSRTTLDITTHGAEFKWAENDVVGIFPNEGSQVSFPMINGAGSNSASFNGGGWALKPASSYAAYYPYDSSVTDPQAISVSYDEQEQIGNASTAHLGKYDFMIAKASTPDNGCVNFSFRHLSSLVQLTLNVPQKGDVTNVSLISDNPIFTNKGYYDLSLEQPSIEPYNKLNGFNLTLKEIVTSADGANIVAYMMMPPGDYSKEQVYVEIVNNGIRYKEQVKLGNLIAGKAYRYSTSNQPIFDSKNTIDVTEPGTLRKLIGTENLANYHFLKLRGNLNGSDIKFIREMIDSSWEPDKGLKELDLYDANIVSGGESYCYYYDYNTRQSDSLYTSDNELGKHMFNQKSPLQRLVLPKTITKIGEGALASCYSLTEIVIPDNVSYIDKNAFTYCSSLKSVKLPNQLGFINEEAFRGCDSIQAFYGPFTSDDNKCIIFNKTLINYASGCTDTSYDVPNGIKSIGKGAFARSNLSIVNLPVSVLNIEDGAFEYCKKLRTVHLPSNLIKIGNSAFNHSDLTSVTIPYTVAEIGKHVFTGCENIEFFNGKYATSDSRALIINNSLVSYASGNPAKEYVLDEDIESIGENAFSYASKLENVKVISPSIKRIENSAFEGCKNLKYVELSDNIYKLGNGVFGGCGNLITVRLPANLREIESLCFRHCWHLEAPEIPNGVERIANNAFFQCESFKSLTLPESIKFLGDRFLVQSAQINKISSLTCYAKEPPYCEGELMYLEDFHGNKYTCDIYVPAESVEKYKSTYPWNQYKILPIPVQNN